MMIDVTDATFEAEVIQRSMTTPVVVDLWAPWCGPCKTLTPILEKVVGETGGRVVLAKINVDENPAASQAFQVQSIPAVYAIDKGQVAANFMGAQPEAQVRQFVDQLLAAAGGGPGAGADLSMLLAQGDEESLRQALELEAGHPQASMMLAQILLQTDRAGEAVEVLSAAPEDDENVAAMLAIARSAVMPAGAQGELEGNLSSLLSKVKGDDDARTEFLSLLDELAAADPAAAAEWRKKLSSALF
jgi:putative thioredoxin